MITVSIVSHGQADLVADLLRDLAALRRDDLRMVVTLNIPEEPPVDPGLGIEFIRNNARLGFGANHNQALRRSQDEFFCILNPDVRLPMDPFPALLEAAGGQTVGLVAPRVLNAAGEVENSARHFPTIASLAAKALGAAPALDYPERPEPFSPDWVAGMFMLVKRAAFESVGGFDERYFLYYEDVDLCRRMRLKGWDIRVVPSATVVHEARKTSHRNPRYLMWHLRSILRYLATRYD